MMKIVLSFVLLCLSCVVEALPIGNPWEVEMQPFCPCFSSTNFGVGYYGDKVFNRRMRVDQNIDGQNLKNTSITSYAGLLVYNICQTVDVFCTLGTSCINITTPDQVFDPVFNTPLFFQPTNDIVNIRSETSFSYSVGLRSILWQQGPFVLGGEGQYFFSNPHINSIDGVGSSRITYPKKNVTIKYSEWQLGLAGAVNLYFGEGVAVIPYAGISWASAKMDMGNAKEPLQPPAGIQDMLVGRVLTLFDLTNQKNWGYAIGLNLIGFNRFSFGIERRFASENAFSGTVQMRF